MAIGIFKEIIDKYPNIARDPEYAGFGKNDTVHLGIGEKFFSNRKKIDILFCDDANQLISKDLDLDGLKFYRDLIEYPPICD